MGVTVVVIGLPNDVTINTIAQRFDALFDSEEIGAFYLCDFREAKYKWHKWQIALHFNSDYDAMIAQNLLDGYIFLVKTAAYLLHARIRNDPNMLNNRLLNMVEVKMLRRSYCTEHSSKLSLVRQLLPNSYYYLPSKVQTLKPNYLQKQMKYRYPKRRPNASNLPTKMYKRGLKSSENEIVKNESPSQTSASVNNLNISTNEAQPISQKSTEDTGNTRYKLLEVDEIPVIEDSTNQIMDRINQLKSVESPLHGNSCQNEIDNNSFLDIEDKIWDTIDEVLQDIRTDIMVKSCLDNNQLCIVIYELTESHVREIVDTICSAPKMESV